MREWNLKAGEPVSLNLSADARLTNTDYCNDQTWELCLTGGEPPAITLQTTYGLRARSARLFPRFVEEDIILTDPADFAIPPLVRRFYPNFIEVYFSPFHGIEVISEYWAVESQIVAGRFTIENVQETTRNLRLELISQLNPAEEGTRMSPVEMGTGQVLAGICGSLAPVTFLTGGPRAADSPYTSLQIDIELLGKRNRQVTWVQAALATSEASFEAARLTAARNIDAERARIEMVNAGIVEVLSGEPDWDAAFSFSQKTALGLFLSASEALPHPSFVFSRGPDHGYSRRSDGLDYPPIWSGQTAPETYFMASLLLPSAPELVKGLLLNFLNNQTESGFIDWKPGLGGQRSQVQAAPLLVSIAWRIYQHTEDNNFLEEVYPKLLSFFQSWFLPTQDRDGDGYPEWTHSIQAGYDDHPVFSFWHPWSQGADISFSESPGLGAFLYRESQDLVKIAKTIGREEDVPSLEEKGAALRNAVEASWDPAVQSYRYWDRDSHYSSKSETLGERQGTGEIILRREFEHPERLLFHIETKEEGTKHVQIFIHGISSSGQHLIERILTNRFQWYLNKGYATSERVYAEVELLDIQGLKDDDCISVKTIDHSTLDQTLLFPLWGGIPAEERVQKIVEENILEPARYWRPFGIPACINTAIENQSVTYQEVQVLWNSLIGEGLLRYGYKREAVEILRRLMSAVTKNLKEAGCFRKNYHAETGQGSGERNAVSGLAPLGLFMDVLGIRLVSPRKVIVSGFNPFSWPVTIKYQGLTVLKQMDKTIVIFSGGETVTIIDPSPHTILLE